jgi:hypothetical protein
MHTKLIIMRHLLIIFNFALPFLCLAQTEKIPVGTGNVKPAHTLETIELNDLIISEQEDNSEVVIASNVNASDGVYDKFVLIRWDAANKGGSYRLFRATAANGKSMLELTKGWQNSNWFCDYSAEKGRDYFYAVMESDGINTAPLTPFDKGFLRKDDAKIVEEGSISAANPDERYASGKTAFVLVDAVVLDTLSTQAGKVVSASIGLQNIFEEAIPRTDLRIYLSKDAIWDFSDQQLISKTYSGFPASFKGKINEKIPVPAEMLSGEYYILVVAAPEGSILNAKVGMSKINITKP